MRRLACALVALATLSGLGCRSGDGPSAGPSRGAPAKTAGHPGPIFVRGPSGGEKVAPFVAAELSRGRAQRYGVLVYVGAKWCEPCQAFHRAARAGELDEMLAGVHLVEFDLDADRDALEAAGYASQLIPLFALPKPDGTASEHRIEGSVKGPEALRQNLVPRLRAFLRGQAEG